MTYQALVLAGGSACRMGGIDKPGVLVGGVSLLDRVLLATRRASETVVVGPLRPTCRAVTWRREDPVGGGPVAALAAGLEAVTAPVVLLLAADLPFLTLSYVEALAAQASCIAVDQGREQWLCGAWRTEDLRAAVRTTDVLTGARLGRLLSALHPSPLLWTGGDRPWTDCDTADDVQRAREIA
jgi:molybdopterin-guanine dinucleotide biosynthesis protein A